MTQHQSTLLEHIVLLFAGLSLWACFYPSAMSFDSLQQYAQARDWNFNDWHPPLMAFILGVILRAGGGIACLTLAVCLAGITGLRALMLEIVKLRLPLSTRTSWAATLTTCGLLLPIFPLPFFLITFWKDTWVAVALLWLTVWLLRQGQQGSSIATSIIVTVVAGFLPSIRHNAVVVLPAISIALFLVQKTSYLRISFALAPWFVVALLALFWTAVGVKHAYISNWMKEAELVALCERWPDKCLPYSRQFIHQPLGKSNKLDHREIPQLWRGSILEPDPDLSREYVLAWRLYPAHMIRMKADLFVEMLQPQPEYSFYSDIDENQFGLAMNQSLQAVRARFAAIGEKAATGSRTMAQLVYHHLVWFVLSHILLFGLLIKRQWFSANLSLIPLSYYYSYLIAATVLDYRLMFPATLFTQNVVLGLVLATINTLACRDFFKTFAIKWKV